jgi:glutamate-1-semialdehyde 2,1-aminomutase
MANFSHNNRSAEAFIKAQQYIPGGVNSPVRAFGGVDTDPIFISRGQGAKIIDIDGKEYIDYVCSWGPLILGHAHPDVVQAVKSAAEKGTSFGAPTEAETELAQRIIEAFESIEKVRMVSSGTEAVMTAVRLARAYTKRNLIVKMEGCYHGHSDFLLASAGSGLAEHSIPSCSGVPESVAAMTIVVDYNDINAVKAVFEKYPDGIAAVLIEPVAANMGVVPPIDGYLQQLRDMCDKTGTILIFDEVITGFRIALGGAQERFGVKSDLTCLGKIIGGGLPGAAFGGKKEIMELLAPTGPVYQAGTLSGNPLATAAAIATIDILKHQENIYAHLEKLGEILEYGLCQASHKTGIDIKINRVGSIMSVFFSSQDVRNFSDVKSSNIALFKKFFAEMLENGIYLAPSAYEAMFISASHSLKDIDRTVTAAEIAFTHALNG